MTTIVLPTRTDAARYSFDIDLDGERWTFRFEWNDRASLWFMSIDGVADSIAVVLNWPLLLNTTGGPRGSLMAIDTSRAETDAGREDLGERVLLTYTP